MFSSRFVAAGVLVLSSIFSLSFGISTQAAGPSPVVLTLNNTTQDSYRLMVCRGGQNIRPLYADFGALSSAARQLLPANTSVDPNSQETYYLHVEAEVLTVSLLNFATVLNGDDRDCSLPAFRRQDFSISSDKTLDLDFNGELKTKNSVEFGTLRVRNRLDEAFLLVVCQGEKKQTVLRSGAIFPQARQDYSLTANAAVYVLPGTVTIYGEDCVQLVAQAYQILYYNYAPEVVATRTIAGFNPILPTPEVKIQEVEEIDSGAYVEVDPLPQMIKVTTPQNRQIQITPEEIMVNTSTREVKLESSQSSLPTQTTSVLIRTGGF